MPKELRKRGRRAEKKRKAAAAAAEEEEMKAQAEEQQQQQDAFYEDFDGSGAAAIEGGEEEAGTTFYGLLSDAEAEYFHHADALLESNVFPSESERTLFVDNVYVEARGKELKLAHSQSASRLLERLIVMSNPSQLKGLFRALSGHFLNAVQHRFASHCCETLFVACAPIATSEMDPDYVKNDMTTDGGDEVFTSMESLFLFMVAELETSVKELLTHRFASHTLRTVMLILAGRPVASVRSLVQSRKKENVPGDLAAGAGAEETVKLMAVPDSFDEGVGKLLTAVNTQFTTLELRSLAVHQIGSPALQIVLQLEMALPKKERRLRARAAGGETLLGKLTGLSEEQPAESAKDRAKENEDGTSEARGFFQNLLYDSIGSHLAESLMRHAPKREFNALYKRFLQPRIGSLARNETAAFVVQRVVERLPRLELETALKEIAPQVPGLVERNRVAVLKSLIDGCARHSIDASGFATAITSAYTPKKKKKKKKGEEEEGEEQEQEQEQEQEEEEEEEDATPLVLKMLSLTPEVLMKPVDETKPPNHPSLRPTPQQLHGSLLCQSMLPHPTLSPPLTDSLLSLSAPQLVALAKHSTASHVLQSAFTTSPIVQRRLLQTLSGNFAALAQHPVGSHIVDAAWTAPTNIRQSIAEELLAAESLLRESFSGRVVWRNWGMDRFKTARRLWFALGKEDGGRGRERKKTAIEMARERYAAGGKRRGAFQGTGANGPLGPPGKRPAGAEVGRGGKKMRVH